MHSYSGAALLSHWFFPSIFASVLGRKALFAEIGVCEPARFLHNRNFDVSHMHLIVQGVWRRSSMSVSFGPFMDL